MCFEPSFLLRRATVCHAEVGTESSDLSDGMPHPIDTHLAIGAGKLSDTSVTFYDHGIWNYIEAQK